MYGGGHLSLRDCMKGPGGRVTLMETPKDTLRFWKWASASIVALLLGNMEGRFFLGLFREKNSYVEESSCGFREICKNAL